MVEIMLLLLALGRDDGIFVMISLGDTRRLWPIGGRVARPPKVSSLISFKCLALAHIDLIPTCERAIGS